MGGGAPPCTREGNYRNGIWFEIANKQTKLSLAAGRGFGF